MVGHPFMSVLRRQRQADLYEYEANLFYLGSSRPVKATQRDLELVLTVLCYAWKKSIKKIYKKDHK